VKIIICQLFEIAAECKTPNEIMKINFTFAKAASKNELNITLPAAKWELQEVESES
jgi:hypothetical protein